MRGLFHVSSILVAALAACDGAQLPGTQNRPRPGAAADAGVRSADAAADASQPADDASQLADDAAFADAGGAADSGAPDMGSAAGDAAEVARDAAVPDSGAGDTGAPDSGLPDSGASDGGTADGGVPPDSGVPPDGGASDPGPAVLNPGWIGGPCMSNADCSFTGGRCLTSAQGYPFGTCTQSCTRLCPDQSGPQNSVTFCVDDGPQTQDGICLSRCDYTLSPTGCRQGYVCLPEKRHNQSNTVRGTCVPRTGLPGRPAPPFDIGAPCTNPWDCARNTCLSGLPGGYCSQEACDVVGCPAGSRCFSFGQDGFHACLKTCASAGECRTSAGYTCDSDQTCWPLPSQRPMCVLTGAAQDCAAYAAMASTSQFVVVTKHLRRMVHCSGMSAVNAYCVGLGSAPVGDKEREGDRRTPEGIFYIPRRIPNSQYYKAFLVSYPDAADAARGLQQGIITQTEHDAIVAAQAARREPPQQTALGGLIEIHGNGSGSDWTWGCIATEDSNIDHLWPVLQVGDTVVILP